MKKLPILNPGDTIEIIAPASRCTNNQLAALIALCESWQLNCLVASDLFGDDLFCANNDEIRFKNLDNALSNPNSKAIICARGGYGSMRLIPRLTKIAPPETAKIFVGMSDCTALQLYLQQQWQWPTIHGALAPDKFSPSSIASLKAILFAEVKHVEFIDLFPLNKHAQQNNLIETSITGGNLCLVQTGIGTVWQMDGRGKIIFLEEIGERGYRIDRMFEHLRQAKMFEDAKAILLGDFLGGEEPDGSSLIAKTLQRFAASCTIPVLQLKGIGHGYVNFPIPLGTSATLKTGQDFKLTCAR